MLQFHTIADLLNAVDIMYSRLNGKFEFDPEGWPIFSKEQFLTDWPTDMITYDNRNNYRINSKSTTVICFFAGDRQNYRRFSKLDSDILIYKNYMGVVFPDITVTKDMDIEMQELTILANYLFAAILATNDIKLVLNTRNGSYYSLKCFNNIPRGVFCASSFLGCDSASDSHETSIYVNKILRLMPTKLAIYGKEDLSVNAQLDILGINYRYFIDFHRRCKREVA